MSDTRTTSTMSSVYLVLLLIVKVFIIPVQSKIDANLIERYFSEKAIKSATVFGCYNKIEQFSLAKRLASEIHPVSISNIKLAGVQKAIKTNHQQIGVVLDGDCIGSENFLISCGQLKFFDVKHHWLVVSSSQSIIKKFEKVILNIDADINIALGDEESQNWTILDVYNTGSRHGGSLHYTKIGYYGKYQGYNARIKEAKYWRRRNMTGVTLKTIVVFLDPFKGTLTDYLHSDDNRNVNTFNRFQHKLLRFCRDFYNYTMETELGESWGYPYPNGSFDGMVGALEQKLIDFGSSPIFVREDRTRVIDYGRNTWSWKAGFLFRSPKSQTSIENFFKPLSSSVWLITGVFALVATLILKMGTTFEKDKYRGGVETSWSWSLIFTLGAFCQQGSPSVPKMACGRIAAIFVFLLAVIIYQFYSASIVSNLLMKPTNKIKNLEDLLKSSLKAGCEDIIYNKDLFAHTTDKLLKEFYHKKMFGKGNTSHYLPPEEGLNYVKSGGYAFHVEEARAYPIIEKTFSDKAICELREVKLFKNTDLYNNYQKASPFYDMLETCFQRIAEHGILFREIKHWHPRKPECIEASQFLVTFHVGLEEFYPALLILLIGMVISLMVLVVEKELSVFVAQEKQPKIPFTN